MFPNRTIYFGDNLYYLQRMPDEYLDGVCIDPPFNSGSNYSNFQDDKVQWSWNQERSQELESLLDLNPKVYYFLKELDRSYPTRQSYLVFMALRLHEIHRILMKHGALFLICDDAEVEYLKVLLDMIFGWQNKLNLINYRRSYGRKFMSNVALKRNHGYILSYAKNREIYSFDDEARLRPLTEEEIEKQYTSVDPHGNRYYANTVTNVSKKVTEFYGLRKKWSYDTERLERLLKEGLLIYVDKTKKGSGNKHTVLKSGDHIKDLLDKNGQFAVYQKEYPKKVGSDLCMAMDSSWEDIKTEQVALTENGGNSGGKTEQLIERCLKFFNTPDPSRSVRILDAFLGFGTTAIVAEKLGYEWIGIDSSKPNIKVTKRRFKGELTHAKEHFEEAEPADSTLKQTDLFGLLDQKPKPKPKSKPKVSKTSFPNVEINVETDIEDRHSNKTKLIDDVIKKKYMQARTDLSRWQENDKNSVRAFSRTIAYKKWVDQEYTCNACHVAIYPWQIEADHIYPYSKGGTSDEDNCQILCSGCNRKKGNQNPETFMKNLEQKGIKKLDRDAQSKLVKDWINENPW